ncbi:uncharacterized protein LOC126900025 isoform X1 [Daktulosphaira vitifoliae]|uniref:uncharacterized protein LOC126900025 isoform X1 n=1 Tax=Daktulosphaira vitifoliae TaxID=58002 RepID=UPI0021AA62FE|nr:uncharacterized protein LOC126900025 isoform X1 [Daktulosphaira vitifoliae]
MNLKFFYIISILWNLKYILTSTSGYGNEILYLIDSVNHIMYHSQFQEKFNLWDNIIKTDDSEKLLNTPLNQHINECIRIPQIFNSIISSINIRYAKLMKLYDGHMKTMINECENYYNKNLFDKFVECTKLIQEVIVKSESMFQTLNDILLFIINLNLKSIFPEYEAPNTVINEIKYFITFILSKEKLCEITYIKSNGEFDTDEACGDLLNVKHFHTEVNHMLQNFPFSDKSSNINSNFVRKCLLEKYNEKYFLPQENYKSFVQFIYDNLIIFYKETIENENNNLGYQELLHPTVPGIKMNLKFFYIISILWNLKYILTSTSGNYDVILYLIDSVNHIMYHSQFQEKFNLWDNIIKIDDSEKLLNKPLNQNNNEINLIPQIFNSIISSINIRYAKLLKLYDGHIKTMINECENYYNKKSFHKFVECTKLIQEVIVNSESMFQTLNDILLFIINLNLKSIFPEYEAPNTVINEIKYFITFILSKEKRCEITYIKSNREFDTDEACGDLLNVKHFHTEVNHMLQNFLFSDKSSNITSNFVRKCLLEKYNEKYFLPQENDKSFVQFIYDNLIIFYKETIENENNNLGYQELLHPTVPGLVPPLKVETTEHRTIALNKLFAKQNFEPFKNIKIILENFEKIDASILFQNEVNSENLTQIETYFEQFLRCRYIEIIKNYSIILTTIINSFRDSKLIGTNNQPILCINQLRLSVSLSINMLKSLLSAMAILKKTCIWEYNKKAPNCLKKLASHITEYVYDLKALNICSSESTKTMNEVKAKTYIDQLSRFHEKLKKGLRYEMPLNTKYQCEFSKAFVHPIKLKRLFIKSKKSSTKCNHSISEHICIYMNKFCEKIINTDYEFLGFRELI